MKIAKCWCGNEKLKVFSQDYLKCCECGTLVSVLMPKEDSADEEQKKLYDREYWFYHQENDLGYKNITCRIRSDLSERCLYWLKILLKYKLPYAKTLELGCSHGAFVALLKQLEFDSYGLEINKWVVDYAKNTFNIPMLYGNIESQKIEPKSLDAIIMMDVLEHLNNPIETLAHCSAALKDDGMLLIQTPVYNENKSIKLMQEEKDEFLKLLLPKEHLFLFGKRAIKKIFSDLGMKNVVFEQAFFPIYDMFLVASKSPLPINTQENIDKVLGKTCESRIVQALLDIFEQKKFLQDKLQESEVDRAARLEVINDLSRKLQESDIDRVNRLEIIGKLNNKLSKIKILKRR